MADNKSIDEIMISEVKPGDSPTCGFCGDSVNLGQSSTFQCPLCGIYMHQDCRTSNANLCPTLGCGTKPKDKDAPIQDDLESLYFTNGQFLDSNNNKVSVDVLELKVIHILAEKRDDSSYYSYHDDKTIKRELRKFVGFVEEQTGKRPNAYTTPAFPIGPVRVEGRGVEVLYAVLFLRKHE